MTRTTLCMTKLVPSLPWLLPFSLLVTLAGYFGPWVPHRVSGLVITGLDLAEYLKFLPGIRSGQIVVWREGFYLPLVLVSLAASFWAFQRYPRRQGWWRWPSRVLLLATATVAALNLLPPAWDQSTFTNPEFRQQIIALGFCLLVMGTSPLWALLPRLLTTGIVVLLGLGSLWYPLHNFSQLLPAIRELYQQPLVAGWGVYTMATGVIVLLVLHGIELCNLDS